MLKATIRENEKRPWNWAGQRAMTVAVRERLHRIERGFAAVCLLVMGAFVFLDVVHRVVTRTQTTWPAWIVFAGLVYTARKSVMLAIAATAAAKGALVAFVWAVPNGLVWSQTVALVLMLWVGCLGASLAARENRHLALDGLQRVWPLRWRERTAVIGDGITALFCVAMAVLSATSVATHYTEWIDGIGVFAALPLPKWVAFAPLPLSFALMAIRFAAQALAHGHGAEASPSAIHRDPP